MMHADLDDVLYKKPNVSAACLTDLSPIRSLAPGSTAQNASVTRRPQSWSERKRGDISAYPYPHLVRSHSPPGHFATSPATSTQHDASFRLDAEATVLSQEAADTQVRMEDTFADVLSREWPFQALPSDTQDFTEAVRAGQESALMHYANDGFKHVFSHLAQEVGAVSIETDRYRLAAHQSSRRCNEALKTYNQMKAELTEAQQRLEALINTKAHEGRSTDAKEKESVRASLVTSEPSVAALTLQLDQELTTMRSQKQRYELLCRQKALLEKQLDGWCAKEKHLDAKLEREQTRLGKELESVLRAAHVQASPFATCAQEKRTADVNAWMRDFDVCITERVELLRHLQDGSAKRFDRFKALLNRTQNRGWSSPNRKKESDENGTRDALPSRSGSGDEGKEKASQEDSLHGDVTSTQVPEYLSKVHHTVALGEEEALTEMEHLRVLLQRLIGREGSRSSHDQNAFLQRKTL